MRPTDLNAIREYIRFNPVNGLRMKRTREEPITRMTPGTKVPCTKFPSILRVCLKHLAGEGSSSKAPTSVKPLIQSSPGGRDDDIQKSPISHLPVFGKISKCNKNLIKMGYTITSQDYRQGLQAKDYKDYRLIDSINKFWYDSSLRT
jgi:hypothetical protein